MAQEARQEILDDGLHFLAQRRDSTMTRSPTVPRQVRAMEQLAEARSSCVRRAGLGWLRGGKTARFPLSPYCGRAGVVLMSMLTPTSGRSGTWAYVHVDAVDADKGQSSPSLHIGLGLVGIRPGGGWSHLAIHMLVYVNCG